MGPGGMIGMDGMGLNGMEWNGKRVSKRASWSEGNDPTRRHSKHHQQIRLLFMPVLLHHNILCYSIVWCGVVWFGLVSLTNSIFGGDDDGQNQRNKRSQAKQKIQVIL